MELNILSTLYLPAPLTKIIKNPPATAKFFMSAFISIWLEKSVWKIIANKIAVKESISAETLVLYPIITSTGNKISVIIAGIN